MAKRNSKKRKKATDETNTAQDVSNGSVQINRVENIQKQQKVNNPQQINNPQSKLLSNTNINRNTAKSANDHTESDQSSDDSVKQHNRLMSNTMSKEVTKNGRRMTTEEKKSLSAEGHNTSHSHKHQVTLSHIHHTCTLSASNLSLEELLLLLFHET